MSKSYAEMNYREQCGYFQFEEDPFGEQIQSIARIMHEDSVLMKCSPTKPEVKDKNKNYYDLYYTVIKNRDEK